MRIFLIRHGESQANVDKDIHKLVPDHDIALTNEGMDQALEAGKVLKNYIAKYPTKPDFGNQIAGQLVNQLLGNLGNLGGFGGLNMGNANGVGGLTDPTKTLFKTRLWNSPYRRARETARIIEGQVKNVIVDSKEDVLLCEQQFGLFDGLSREDIKEKFPEEFKCYDFQKKSNGKFWARFPQGESAFDVACRLRLFLETIKRDESEKQIIDHVIVCHGTVLRLFTQIYLNKTWEWFAEEPNPGNTAIRLLENNQDGGYIHGGYIDEKPWTCSGNKRD